ncbi:N-acetyldiaminopimelate deacetylase [Vagococcus fluvialis]|uniref:N-acetyldiaminopimelate deacetylase n=1 Tax=Vagococcus fluvialis TaxID=2738 RepID=UPI003BF3D1FC
MMFSKEELIKIRRELHQIPEIGLKEFKTHDYLIAVLNSLPQEHLEIKTKDTAIIVTVKGKNPRKTIAWRTDIDGLPIKEETGFSFESTHEGFMHACGHDFHMTIALGLIARQLENRSDNNYVFFFQPAEENLSGAEIYYDNGFLKDIEIDEIYALHVAPQLKSNLIGTLKGTLFAGACRFVVTFKGKDGHAAFPHLANDTIVAASSFVQQVQSIISRNVDPMESAVITFGEFNSGTADNIVSGKAVLTGTIRALTYEVNELTKTRMEEMAKGIALSYGCEVDIVLDQKGYIPVVNNTELTSDFIEFCKIHSEIEFLEVSETMTAEDFGYLLSKIPGTMFWYGVDSEYGLHHGKFNPDENTLDRAVNGVHDFLKSRDK